MKSRFEEKPNLYEQPLSEEIIKEQAPEKEATFYQLEKVEKELDLLFKEAKDRIKDKGLDEPSQDKTEVEKKVEAFIILALDKGVKHAIDKVCSLDSPFLLDAFHDGLVERLKEKRIN